MIYLDTGCLLKLYYPEPSSAAVAAAVAGKVITFTALHELETVAALQLKCFRGEATQAQADAALALLHGDLAGDKFSQPFVNWPAVLRATADLAAAHSGTTGCRSLDVIHCALARATGAEALVSSDARQIALAKAASLRVVAI